MSSVALSIVIRTGRIANGTTACSFMMKATHDRFCHHVMFGISTPFSSTPPGQRERKRERGREIERGGERGR